jgi:hypothetical protein
MIFENKNRNCLTTICSYEQDKLTENRFLIRHKHINFSLDLLYSTYNIGKRREQLVRQSFFFLI